MSDLMTRINYTNKEGVIIASTTRAVVPRVGDHIQLTGGIHKVDRVIFMEDLHGWVSILLSPAKLSKVRFEDNYGNR